MNEYLKVDMFVGSCSDILKNMGRIWWCNRKLIYWWCLWTFTDVSSSRTMTLSLMIDSDYWPTCWRLCKHIWNDVDVRSRNPIKLSRNSVKIHSNHGRYWYTLSIRFISLSRISAAIFKYLYLSLLYRQADVKFHPLCSSFRCSHYWIHRRWLQFCVWVWRWMKETYWTSLVSDWLRRSRSFFLKSNSCLL